MGDYAHVGLLGLNIINAHAMLAMGILKGAGANFAATSGSSGMTINQKYLLNWAWLKSCTNTAGTNEDGNVGYGRAHGGGDDQDRTRYIMPGLAWAVTSGNLPSFPTPSSAANRIYVRMNSPRNDWPQLAARRV